MKNLLFIFPLFIFALILASCGGTSEAEQQRKIDSMYPEQKDVSNSENKDAAVDSSEDAQPEKPFHLSPADSTRVADSVFHSQNGVRDFK